MQKQYNKDKKGTRITIFDTDLEEWGCETLDKDLVKKWIKMGKEKGDLEKRLDTMDKKMDRFIKMIAYFSHHSYMQSALTPLMKDLSDEEYEDAWDRKNDLSWKVRDAFFPEFKIRSMESDLDDWLNEQEDDHS